MLRIRYALPKADEIMRLALLVTFSAIFIVLPVWMQLIRVSHLARNLRCKIEVQMELILNLVWAMLAVVCAGLWMRDARHCGVSPRVQAIALLLFIVILLPVISVTDDLQSLQYPAELDCCARRHCTGASSQSVFSAVAALPPMAIAEFPLLYLCKVAPGSSPLLPVKNPALAAIQNRPPPSA